MTDKEKEGYELAKGAALYVSKCFVFGLVAATAWLLLSRSCHWGMDDSDESSWNRSGLIVHKDAKTGIEYFSDRHGGLVRRESR